MEERIMTDMMPNYERPTYDNVWKMFQETDKKYQEIAESFKETDRQFKETDRQFKETDKKYQEIARRFEETDKKFQETDRFIKELGKKTGNLDHRFGELAEHLVAPGIAEKFNALGYRFDSISPGGKKITDAAGKTLAEVDLLLENGDFIVAVEVKAKPRQDDIAEHLERLTVLRRHYDKHHDTRKIRGAVAGAIFPGAVKTVARKAGLYVIEQSGDTMKIEVSAGFRPRDW
jgi:hypothetical protein